MKNWTSSKNSLDYVDLFQNVSVLGFCDVYVYYLDFSSRIYQEFEVTVPDSITSWVATGFVISEDLGLGLTKTPVEVLY